MNGVSFGQWEIPESELEETFSTSGGPGGQHANRNETAVSLSVDLEASSLPGAVAGRVIETLGDPILVVTVSESRSQWRNRALARRRMGEVLEKASKPRRRRRKTKPTRASKRRRLEEKRKRSEVKRNRQKPRDW